MRRGKGAGGLKGKGAGGLKAKAAKEDFQVVSVERSNKRHRVLDAEGLALGCQIASSKKRGRDLMDDSFHRFANSEGQWEVPEWFFDDERKHRKKPTPVTQAMVDEFKQKWKEINARPIKRVAEAKARKKKRMMKKTTHAHGAEEYVRFVAVQATPRALTTRELERASAEDEELSEFLSSQFQDFCQENGIQHVKTMPRDARSGVNTMPTSYSADGATAPRSENAPEIHKLCYEVNVL
ncbi:unnamed protein product [Boreogadus saida]